MALPSKQILTTVFLEQCSMATDSDSIKQYLWLWWKNPISKTSLRLTSEGFEFLTDQVNLASYLYYLQGALEITPKLLLMLDKHISVPFYLKTRRKIVFFGENDAIMLAIYGNDLVKYLTVLDENQPK